MALLQYELDIPLCRLARQIGLARAERLWRRSKLALEALDERLHRLGLGDDCSHRSSLYLQGVVLDAAGLREEAKARRRAGFEVSLRDRGDVQRICGIKGRAALLSHGGMAADPRKLAAGSLLIALARGARLDTPVEAIGIDPLESGAVVHTAEGPSLRARAVVFATGCEMPKGVPRMGNRVTSTWAPQRVRSCGNCFAALGYGGNGIIFSMLSAAIVGGHDPDADLFSFRRRF